MITSPSFAWLSLTTTFLSLYARGGSGFVPVPLLIRTSATTELGALSNRELEIRRKIKELKQQGRLKKKDIELDDQDDDEVTDYSNKIRQKLGATKSKLLGFEGEYEMTAMEEKPDGKDSTSKRRNVQIGALAPISAEGDVDDGAYKRLSEIKDDIVPEDRLHDDGDSDDDDDGMDQQPEDDLVELVALRMQEMLDRETREKQARLKQEAREELAAIEEERKPQVQKAEASAPAQIASGIGGSWDRESTVDAEQDVYQPKSGSWGAFPRPRDISKAYGGGRRVGPGYSNEQKSISSVEETRQRLQRYRVKVGIDVESEKEHAAEIDEALKIATYAMQRGVYSNAVSVLEKVTKYCSSNSKVGGKVFLELAMAYEAVGRTKEAITVYTTLSRSRTEEVKSNAKRLLYGIEAMQFMQEQVGSSEFSRKQAKRTFIDTTGLANIASKFDDVYETAYIDLDSGFYKKLTEAVVRSSREARQILLRATGPGEVGRLRIVQALRSLSRHFGDALQAEIDMAKPTPEPTAVMDGKPILPQTDRGDLSNLVEGMDEFVLMGADQMKENIAGEWRLQLIADKRGDGVKFFNSTLAWQKLDTESMTFASLSPQGFLTVKQSGRIKFNNKQRILRRSAVELSGGGGMLTGLFGTKTGPVGAICSEQQVVTVDTSMLVTRGVPAKRSGSAGKDDEKDYFAVWRRVEPGTFSGHQKS